MPVTYVKRYRMEVSLSRWHVEPPLVASSYRFLPWEPHLIEAHAETKHRSFRGEIDANVFPCLGDAVGCQRLMEDIASRFGFCPEATWLIGYQDTGTVEYCGTIQGVRDGRDCGGIQNVGIVPEHRRRGLATALLCQALLGFRQVGVRRVYLEVTAHNAGAVHLYQRLGFHCAKVVYKAVEAVYS
jgi:GNAT superfamily N-acetyltransferase